MKVANYYCLALLPFLFFSCGASENKTGLPEKDKTVDFVSMQLKLKKETENSPTGYDHPETICFQLKYRFTNEKGAPQDVLYKDIFTDDAFQKRVHALSFELTRHFFIETKGVRIPCRIAHFEQNYFVNGERTSLVYFNTKDLKEILSTQEPFTLIYEDEEFGLGVSEFYFNKEDVTQINLYYHV